MTARTHDLAAITALGIVAVLNPPASITLGTAILAVVANQIGGIFPDIDQPTAPFWRNLPIGGFIGRMIDKMLGGHRFLTHSLIGLALTGLLLDIFLHFIHPLVRSVSIDVVWWSFMIGMLSHLIMDTFTKEGVPWLLPIPFKFGFPPIKKLRLTTGKYGEKIVFVGLLVFDAWFLSVHYHQLSNLVHSQIH